MLGDDEAGLRRDGRARHHGHEPGRGERHASAKGAELPAAEVTAAVAELVGD